MNVEEIKRAYGVNERDPTLLSFPRHPFQSSRGSVVLIIGPVVGGALFVAIIGVVVFLAVARRKRRNEGKYDPQTAELKSPRLQLDDIIKPPPPEGLI